IVCLRLRSDLEFRLARIQGLGKCGFFLVVEIQEQIDVSQTEITRLCLRDHIKLLAAEILEARNRFRCGDSLLAPVLAGEWNHLFYRHHLVRESVSRNIDKTTE